MFYSPPDKIKIPIAKSQCRMKSQLLNAPIVTWNLINSLVIGGLGIKNYYTIFLLF